MVILFFLVYDMNLVHIVKGFWFWVKERILLRYFSVPASLETCVCNRGTAWIHKTDALQAWHLWDQNYLQNSSWWSFSSPWHMRMYYLCWWNHMPSIIVSTPFLRNSPQLSMSEVVLYITRVDWNPSKHKTLQNDQQIKELGWKRPE